MYLKADFYLNRRDQSGCMFSHQEKSKCIYECCGVESLRFWQIDFVMTTLIPSSLFISCELSFPIVGLKIFFP
jgi:hypothetical protein